MRGLLIGGLCGMALAAVLAVLITEIFLPPGAFVAALLIGLMLGTLLTNIGIAIGSAFDE